MGLPTAHGFRGESRQQYRAYSRYPQDGRHSQGRSQGLRTETPGRVRRTSLFQIVNSSQSAEEQYVSIFQLFNEHRSRIRKSERNILPKYRTLVATICATFGNPLPEEAWDSKELFTGDDFWGDVAIPFTDADITDGTIDRQRG